MRKSPSLHVHGRKSNPNPKFIGTAEAYFVCHIGPKFQNSFVNARDISPIRGASTSNVLDHPNVLDHLNDHLGDHLNDEGHMVNDEGYVATGYVVTGTNDDVVSNENENDHVDPAEETVSFINSTGTTASTHSGPSPGPTRYAIPKPNYSFANMTGIIKIIDPSSVQPTSSADTSGEIVVEAAASDDTAADADYVPDIGAEAVITSTYSIKTTSDSEASEVSAVETFHAGETHSNLYGHLRGTRSQDNESIQKWMTTESGARSRHLVAPRGAAVKAKAKIRSSLVSLKDQIDASYTRPDTPRVSLVASAAAASRFSAHLGQEMTASTSSALAPTISASAPTISAASATNTATSMAMASASTSTSVAARSYPTTAARVPSPVAARPVVTAQPAAQPVVAQIEPPQHGVRPARRSLLRPVMRMRPVAFGQPTHYMLRAAEASDTSRARVFREYVGPETYRPEADRP